MRYLSGSIFLLFLLCGSVYAYGGNEAIGKELHISQAQVSKVKVSGKVVDESGKPLSGANIVENGTTNGVIADVNGDFTFFVTDNSIITISFIGYESQAILVRGQQYLYIKMSEDALQLDGVVVTALCMETS